MRKLSCCVLFLLLCSFTASAQFPILVAAGVGTGIPLGGLNYNLGLNLKAGTILQKKYYAGVSFGVHTGDKKYVYYNGTFNIGVPPGHQGYKTSAMFITGDFGYEMPVRVGGLKPVFTPYVTAGIMNLSVTSEGVYGSDKIKEVKVAIGAGIAGRYPINKQLSVGLDYRMYAMGKGSFDFGSKGDQTNHGFSASTFYAAIFAGAYYRLK